MTSGHKLHLVSLGCSKNQVDSERMAALARSRSRHWDVAQSEWPVAVSGVRGSVL